MQENKKKGEVQFLKMTRFDVLNNVERKQNKKRSSISKDDAVWCANQCKNTHKNIVLVPWNIFIHKNN